MVRGREDVATAETENKREMHDAQNVIIKTV